MAKLDLPISLLDRLLASRIVPLQAKLEAVARWRDELTEAASVEPRARQLQQHLAMAYASLRKAGAAKGGGGHIRSARLAFAPGVSRGLPQLARRRAAG
jgi:hypothetical protein